MRITGIPLAILLLLDSSLWCLAQDQRPHFDAASLKVSPPESDPADSKRDPGRIDFKKASLEGLICIAYGVRREEVIHKNPWPSEPYDLVATMPPETTKPQVNSMLQVLLEERFKLKTHRESKEMDVYVAIISKNGPKLTKAEPTPEAPILQGVSNGERYIKGIIAIPGLINSLSRTGLDRPLVDRTSLEGYYRINLSWTPDDADGGPQGRSLFAALERQLGIHVEPRKASVEMLVVDSFLKTPVAN